MRARSSADFANGSLAIFESTRYARGHKALYTFEINGADASIAWDLHDLHRLSYFDHRDESIVRGWRSIHVTDGDHPYMGNWWVPGLQIGYEHTFVHQVADFLDGLAKNKPTSPTFREASKPRKFATPCLPARKAGQWVEVECEFGSRRVTWTNPLAVATTFPAADFLELRRSLSLPPRSLLHPRSHVAVTDALPLLARLQRYNTPMLLLKRPRIRIVRPRLDAEHVAVALRRRISPNRKAGQGALVEPQSDGFVIRQSAHEHARLARIICGKIEHIDLLGRSRPRRRHDVPRVDAFLRRDLRLRGDRADRRRNSRTRPATAAGRY